MGNDEFQEDHIDFTDENNEGGFEEFEGGGTTLGDMWRNNPLVKIGVFAGALITIFGAIILFGGAETKTPSSVMRAGSSTVSAPPGGEVSQEYREAVEEQNVQRLDEAIRQGGSTIPTPVDTPIERLALPSENVAAEDPLERWRRIQEERQRQTSQREPVVEAPDPYADATNALATAMAGQMDGILASKEPREMVSMTITTPEYIEELREQEKAKMEAEAEENAGGSGETIVNILIPAGTIAYAQLITEANTDSPGPILAQLVSGPLAGSRLLGTFDETEEYLVLEFNTIIIDGIAHSTEAIAMDPETTRLGMATEIDKRYFSRIVLPAAAAFVEGIGEAIASTNETTVVVSDGAAVQDQEELDTREEIFKGVEKAAEKVSEIIDEDAENIEPMIRVHAGTPMGLLFVQPVTDETQ